ncbi:MAG: S-methyl-5'-thioadenosine phosphorylase [Pseudomonadota bacterium]
MKPSFDKSKTMLGVIGGSGVYDVKEIEGAQRVAVSSSFGAPSSELVRGRIAGVDVVFLARHGNGHHLSPTDVNYRANIDALKRAGVTDILSVSACGSFREELSPGTFVIVDQFIDRTHNREKSFFGAGCVAHVSMAEPVCPRLGDAVEAACKALDIPHHRGGTYLAMEGPQFSSLAESKLYRSWGCDVIGMTNMPEAKLAREAELPYATVAMVTDYDCWHMEHEAVSVSNVIEVLHANAAKARELIKWIAPKLGPDRPASPIDTVLDHAIITAPEARDPKVLAKLDAVAGRVLAK